jgi:hypothetical protein
VLKILLCLSEEVNAMKRKTAGFLALLFGIMWVLATAVPSEAGRYHRGYYGHGYSHFRHRPFVVGSYYYAPYYYRPNYYRPYYYNPYSVPYGYTYPYPYYGVPGWPYFWPGVSFRVGF